jgi:hypothetical protein
VVRVGFGADPPEGEVNPSFRAVESSANGCIGDVCLKNTLRQTGSELTGMNACLPVDPHVLGQEKNPVGTGLKAEAFSFSAFARCGKPFVSFPTERAPKIAARWRSGIFAICVFHSCI